MIRLIGVVHLAGLPEKAAPGEGRVSGAKAQKAKTSLDYDDARRWGVDDARTD